MLRISFLVGGNNSHLQNWNYVQFITAVVIKLLMLGILIFITNWRYFLLLLVRDAPNANLPLQISLLRTADLHAR